MTRITRETRTAVDSAAPAANPLYTMETGGRLHPYLQREWLLTNGMGAFAMGTVVGCNTRRYHGLLCAARTPPVGRVMTLSRVGEIVYPGGDESRAIELSINQFRGNLHPRGDQHLNRFLLDETAAWEYEAGEVLIRKELLLCWMRNVVGLRYTVDPGAAGRARLDLLPFAALRDFHALRQAAWGNFQVEASERRVSVRTGDDAGQIGVHMTADAGRFTPGGDWWYGHLYPVETDRGQDDSEDLYCPGRFIFETDRPATITLWASAAPLDEAPRWEAQLRRARDARSAGRGVDPGQSTALRRLFRAAEDFVVWRKAPDGADGTSILAGYPWFADWGRDTFISLPGLLLGTGRFEQAMQTLRLFGEYVSEGMIPNRFDDYTSAPSYNTVDASLWYIHAAFEYRRLSKDASGFERWMRPACRKIIDGYKAGTRFNIRMEEDGLITQGDYSTQLTWMDAKCGGVAFTPRQGKPVEINALWHHALALMEENELSAYVAGNFRRAFWLGPDKGLADVVEGTSRDEVVRPNQIFAVSLPHSPLLSDQQRAVVEIVQRELLTPVGLRTLNAANPNYRGRYGGPPIQRDACYHNGTIWPWPIGAFLDAYLKVHGRSPQALAQARQWLTPLVEHLEQNCIGQIAEIFEADPPHRPVGCPAQAWSVAEVLRLALDLQM